ncbi:hypothetical protein N185_16445 [Sinorhizobium sp. GW3]|nr:hypothetical protein N185_16445 [Sinorhizobium sp. GW3]
MMKFETIGEGEPLVMVHGLGGSAHSWDMVVSALAKHRRLLLLNLPGHGGSAARLAPPTFDGMVQSVEEFLNAEDLGLPDIVGSSLGGRIVLELARRGRARSAIALDPGGFWTGWEANYVFASLMGTIKIMRALGRYRRLLVERPGRLLALKQLSYKPSGLQRLFLEREIENCAKTGNFEAIAQDLTTIAPQAGPAAGGVSSVSIGWGRQDRLCLPRQAARAQSTFPGAALHWFEECGHFPMWDQPRETAAFILAQLKG